ncbi:SDR family NAD(P)-dependent oxidoreductase [Paenibacillus taichungensis]|uniref:SDR family NAD(P)-dependent oxidoreductase n=1 Tax=Paenibacillus taichungensis TaxID=484184 RepID=A0ABX2MDD7_9BACL|nr:SDR family NAD(P)-dependent oxidoreductase [Paenibacillus taichungensis]NUU52695.1 SDR family NAD(P)-dependent oxidoreductase [Paenibacillus taichungensis]
MKTLVIVGAGPEVGQSLARKFGKNGFQIALIARNQSKLDQLVLELEQEKISATSFVADLYNKEQLEGVFTAIKERYDSIDVVEFSPTVGNYPPTPAWQVIEENALDIFNGYMISAIRTVQSVLPDMIERSEGALLFTTGLSALYPMQMMGNIGITMAGLRNYLLNLHTDLAPKGIYVGHLSLGVFIKKGTQTDPDYIADAWFDMYTKGDKAEETFPVGVTPETIVW